ncbi:hypothetical protein MATL_G00177850 [Megalops atlanticus]|uniref:Uncharacterized protein n=1 Tax=Megalops atlanticus TaxID=7932 RepID=A0A9D3T221_MEGAT|nr:hypothetical protein MATL_G00177850 [Megalops atlanticus]
MHDFHLQSKLLLKLVTAGGAVAILAFFIAFQYIFRLDFVCPCDPVRNVPFCTLYLLLPFCIMSLVLVLIDPRCTRICRFHLCRRNCWPSMGRCFLMAMCAGSLWVITALIDGDWFVCLMTTNNSVGGPLQIPCLDEHSLTSEQRVVLNHYLNLSRVIGLGGILVIAVLWSVLSCVTHRHKSYYKSLYEEYLEEQTEAVLKERLRELAKEKAEEICTPMIEILRRPGEEGNLIDMVWVEISNAQFYQTCSPSPLLQGGRGDSAQGELSEESARLVEES